MKIIIIKDNEILWFLPKSNDYHSLTPNELFEENPKYLLWMHLNLKAFKFTDGIRKKLNKFKKDNPGIAKELSN